MAHYKTFFKSKLFTYSLLFTFFFIMVFTSILVYQEKIDLTELWSAAGAELAILIPIVWNIVKTYKAKKVENKDS